MKKGRLTGLPFFVWMRLFFTVPLGAACLLFPFPAVGQDPASGQNAQEISSSESPFTFESKVNLVLVPVVVRDKNGKAVGSLQKEDFELRDRGKVQEILRFSVEHAAATRATDSREAESGRPSGSGASLMSPGRFVAYLFDDIHGEAGDLARSRAAAERNIQKTLSPSDRIAVFTTTGSVSLDFTNDLAKVNEALRRITPHRSRIEDCPDENYYMADLIRNKNDLQTLALATAEAEQCLSLPAGPAQNVAISAAVRILATGDEDTRLTLDAVDRAIGALSSSPGQRILVLGTPGYLRLNDKLRTEARLIDRAIRNEIVIGSVDIRGLATQTIDASVHTENAGSPTVVVERKKYDRWSRLAEWDSMTQLATATGGAVIRNNNDLEGAFHRTGSSADVWYILGFSPRNLSNDGAFHPLKVAVRKGNGLNVEARPGYYAPTHAMTAEENARDEISEAIFSRIDEKAIPITVRTEFVKTSENEALLKLHANLDVRGLHYRAAGDRSVDQLRLAFTLFDRDGKLVEGASRKLEMRLRQETLRHRLDAGINVNVEFKAPPGLYVVRVVARDDEGQALGSRSKAVEIP